VKIEATRTAPNLLIVAQKGRLQYEALLAAASLRQLPANRNLRLCVAEPQPGPLWQNDPRMDAPIRAALQDLGAEVVPLHSRHFGHEYPHGNKIEALRCLPEGEPFLFLDSDTLITGALADVPFDFDQPSASLRCEPTWPSVSLYGAGYEDIWRALYDRFGLAFEPSEDTRFPKEFWRRYLYFNAGWFYYRCPRLFGQRMLEYAREVKYNPPPEIACQQLRPWLDQIVLPLVITALGGGRDRLPAGLLDGRITCHYRALPLFFARESDDAVAMLEKLAETPGLRDLLHQYQPFRRMLYKGQGRQVRALFDRNALPDAEGALRKIIWDAGLWAR
jgi:hypothetical protein